MVDRRETEPLEPRLGDSSQLREVGDDTVVEEVPSLCVDLRRARMSSGRELAQVAATLRIRLIYLEALEEGRFDDLPGTTYASGFLRTYSEFLGIDPDEMVERLKRETATGVDQRDLLFPVPPKEGRNPKPWLIIVVLAVAGLAYGGWHVYSTNGKVATEIVSDVSTTLTEAAGLSDDEAVMADVATEPVAVEEEPLQSTIVMRADSTAGNIGTPEQSAGTRENSWISETSGVGETHSSPQATAAAAGESELPVTASVIDETATVTTPISRDPALTGDSLWDNPASNDSSESDIIVEVAAPEITEAAPIIRNANARALDQKIDPERTGVELESASGPVRERKIYGEENTDFRIEIAATADSWVQIQGPNNELILTRILRTGDVYQVPNRPGLLMVTGNAGALEVRVDGDMVASLGPIGVVRRNVSLDPDTLVANTVADSEQ